MINRLRLIPAIAGLVLAHSSCAGDSASTHDVAADVWADNWFALYREDELLAEDAVPYQTERSFNSESFSFTTEIPVRLSVIIKDFKEDDSGLEYIGSRRQQIGDGGFIAQFVDAKSGELLAVSDDSWQCVAIHQAPLNKSCERSDDPATSCGAKITPQPDGWKLAAFDDSDWPAAVVHSSAAVRPHGGYSAIDWQLPAQLIWSADLEVDNTVLCRFTLGD